MGDVYKLIVLSVLFGYISCTGLSADLTPGNWDSCQDGQEAPPSRTVTTDRVEELRSNMQRKNLGAYVTSSSNAHLSEFVSGHEKRRQYISGFSGSSGTVVVTMKHAALWTDGRYFLQAESELGCDWILMKEGESGLPSIVYWMAEEDEDEDWFFGEQGVPSIVDWIVSEMAEEDEDEDKDKDKDKVKDAETAKTKAAGASPFHFGNDEWLEIWRGLSKKGITFYAVRPDLVDRIWTEDREPFPSTTINALPIEYTGMTWQSKVTAVQQEMEKQDVDILIITALDETAWLFNARATDIRGFVNDPFFYSVAIIPRERKSVKLYIQDPLKKLSENSTDPATKMTLAQHLNTNENGSCVGKAGFCVQVDEYQWNVILRHLSYFTNSAQVKRVWISHHTNYAVYSSIPQSKLYVKNTPVAMMKAKKNDVEIQGMKNANLRDCAALARFMAKLEPEVRDGYDNWTEVSAMNELSKYRSMQEMNRGDSFMAISSVGPHAAINHYFASDKTDRPITNDETYLLDSGGQYLDGTTDITRTFLFREPTAFEKETYTRVLMGQINLAMVRWNRGLYGREIDQVARKPLWDVGLIYRHGTGHGIGHYLSVHEGPGRISNYHKRFVWDVPLEENMFFSDEPGFYQEGEFGIRLENIIYVKKVKSKYLFTGADILGMETITFFPYEPHMIDTSIMTDKQLSWLDEYHDATFEKLGAVLLEQNDTAAYAWLERRIAPLTPMAATSSAADIRGFLDCMALMLGLVQLLTMIV